jgi:hypothetical protein
MGIEYVHGGDEPVGLMKSKVISPEEQKLQDARKRKLERRQAILAVQAAAKAARSRRKKAIEKASRKRNRGK